MKKLISLLMILCIAITLITPSYVKAADLKLSKSKATMEVDSTLTLKLGNLSGTKVSWSTSDKTIVSVSSSGVITAKSEGSTTITATYQKKKYTCKVKVVDSNTNSNSSNAKSETPFVSASPDITGIKSYKSKQYKVENDLPAGEYILFTNGRGLLGHYLVSSDADGNNVLFKGAFKTNAIVTVNKGEYLKFTRSTAYPTSEFYESYIIDLNYDNIILKGGSDLKAGEYELVTTGKNEGYYCIYDNSRYEEIIVEETFEKECYVCVGEGQYLILKGCKVKLV